MAAARTGIPTTFVEGVGCAVFGEETKRFWEKEYIDPRVIEYHSVPTNNTGIFVSGNAENAIIVALGANLTFPLEDFTEDVFAGSQIVVCQNEILLETTLAVLEGARRRGISTVLNPAPMIPDYRAEYLTNGDILIPNETEFSELVGTLLPDTHDSFTPCDIEDLPDYQCVHGYRDLRSTGLSGFQSRWICVPSCPHRNRSNRHYGRGRRFRG